MIYNNATGEANVMGMAVPTVKLSKEEGEKLVQQIKEGKHSVVFSFKLDKSWGNNCLILVPRACHGYMDD